MAISYEIKKGLYYIGLPKNVSIDIARARMGLMKIDKTKLKIVLGEYLKDGDEVLIYENKDDFTRKLISNRTKFDSKSNLEELKIFKNIESVKGQAINSL